MAVLVVAAVAASCVWALARRVGLDAATGARNQWPAQSAAVTGFRDLDAAIVAMGDRGPGFECATVEENEHGLMPGQFRWGRQCNY